MKQRTRKKLTSMLLVFCMLLSLLPSSVIAADLNTQTGNTELSTPELTETATAAAPSNPLKLAESCNILRYVNEEVFMQSNHIARLNAQETLSSYAFLKSDGTTTVYYMDEEVKFIAADGTVQEKDITLTTATGGYTTVCNDVKLNLPTNPASGISLVYGNYSATLKPQGRTFSKSPVLENNTVTYPDYFGEGMDLVYTPTLSGVKEDIVLESYTGVNSFTFMLNTRGLNLYQANGRYFLSPSKVSDMRIELGDIVSFDARGRFSVGTMTATTVTAGSLYQLTITVDEGFLTDENTTYPVSIDPTLTVSDNTHGAGAIEDATLYSGVPTLNSGSWTYLHCGYYDSTYQVSRTAIGFAGLIADGAFWRIYPYGIASAKFYIREAGWTAGVTVNMHEIRGAWSENTITWSTHGNSYYSDVVASASPSYGSYAEFDITAIIQDWHYRDDYGYGFMLVSTNETSVDKTLYSSENGTSTRPYVVVTYRCNPFYSDYSSADYYRNTLDPDDTFFMNPIEAYKDDGLQFRANCYGYAFRFAAGEEHLWYGFYTDLGNPVHSYKQIPGEFANKTNGLRIYNSSNQQVVTIYTYADLVAFYDTYILNSQNTSSDAQRLHYLQQLLVSDANTLGYSITEYTGDAIPDAQRYQDRRLIAVVVTEHDFHFYMQHSDNTWSHKPGELEPSNVCFDHSHALTNDNIREHACEDQYSSEETNIKFYYITKNAVIDCMHYDDRKDEDLNEGLSVQTVMATTEGAGNCFTTAKYIGLALQTYINASIDYVGDIDCYYFITNNTTNHTITASSTNNFPLVVTLYNAQGNILHQAQSATGSIGFTLQLDGSSQYFIAFSSQNQIVQDIGKTYSFSIVRS